MELKNLYEWCAVRADALENDPRLKVPFRMVRDSKEMGYVMAQELADEIETANAENRIYRAIIPCGPNCWYKPFEEIINARNISLKNFVVFHMDECLDWEGQLLHHDDPYNFRSFMEEHFYGGIKKELQVPLEQRFFLSPATMETVRTEIYKHEIDITYGGWGQDGHIAYNQARRNQYSRLTLDQLRNASIRIQVNNDDTIMALAQRTFGAGYQFVPPMSITLGIKECLRAKKVRLFSDTGAWKQTALRVALFSEPDAEYPMTLLQEHPDALLTATVETATHPISLHPEWRFKEVHDA